MATSNWLYCNNEESGTMEHECPPALQTWYHSSTQTNPNIYANMDFLFWKKENIVPPDSESDPYPWNIWYFWKGRNDKLFRRIDRDLLELVGYAESDC